MSFPMQKDIEEPLLREIAQRGGEARPNELYQAVARHFPQLTSQDLSMKMSSGLGNKWGNTVQWARQKLVEKGELDKSVRGVWRITDKGKKRIRFVELGPMPPPPPPPPRRHEELKKMVVDIGKALGYHTSTEERQADHRYDVLWRPGGKPYMTPIYAIEICDGGSLPKDFDVLQWARENWENVRGLLVVTDQVDYQKTVRRFTSRPEIRPVMASTIEALHELINRDQEFFKWLLAKR